MSSSIETIGHKLQSLEERLQAENESRLPPPSTLSRNPMSVVPSSTTALPAAASLRLSGIGGVGSMVGSGNSSIMRQPPRLPLSDPSAHRSRHMMLSISTPSPAAETETDKKLKMIMPHTGTLTINGRQYSTDIKDLVHLGDLGSGTSGNVVKMRHVPTDTIIAVKQMRRTGNTEENKRIFMDLDVVLKSHDCDYIVQCLGCFVRDSDVWICMELMSMCFDKLLKLSKKSVPEPILGKVTVATVNALSYLKDKHNVIHRDVKPSNILIDERGNIKLCDFGISGRLVDSKANTRSAGCAAYMAPERIDPKKPKYDIRADVWSLGITLVELATARSPYDGCNNDFEVLTKVLESDPPSLPRGDDYNFSPELHDFVNKCLTKNHQHRPKYPELLSQPFIKTYERVHVDVPKWFRNVVETAHIKTHNNRTIMPEISYNKSSTAAALTATITGRHTATDAMSSTTTNTKAIKATHIPTYQHHHHYQQQQQQHYQASQLPQPIITTATTTTTTNYYSSNVVDGSPLNPNHAAQLYANTTGGGGGGGSGSSSATSSSPLSPPSVCSSGMSGSNNFNANETMNKLYRKSPFMQRKLNNGAGGSGVHAFKYNDDSPKKESMFSSIGQSILRNLTTSPFSQKKHSLPQTNQIDTALWRMQPPTTTTATPQDNMTLAFNNWDYEKTGATAGGAITNTTTSPPPLLPTAGATTAHLKYAGGVIGSPAMQRKQQQTLIPINNQRIAAADSATGNSNNSGNSHSHSRTQSGNHSPIVLQRFYHQQNQLREKERELREREHPHQHAHHPQHYQHHGGGGINRQTSTSSSCSTESNFIVNSVPSPARMAPTTTNPFHSNYQPMPLMLNAAATTTTAGGGSGGGGGASSSHSTSSQSSTQSTCSQIAAYDYQQQLQQLQQNRTTTASSSCAVGETDAPAAAAGHFGIGTTGHLQYQPLAAAANVANVPTATSTYATTSSTSIATPPTGGGMHNNRSTYATDNAASSGSSSISRSAATTTTKTAQKSSNGYNTSSTTNDAKCYYYRTQSADRNTSPAAALTANSTTTTSTATSAAAAATSASPFKNEFRTDAGTSAFLRRYAGSSPSSMGMGMVGGSCSTPPSPHILAGLDRRNRSPDPPPRYNRGQSPLLLRKNLLELSGQPPGSPLLNRRYVSASPPLPPPRRGSESVPGSPQHFRTRIHYTPEPQRRIYRTIDQ